jgi:hypothetical protein
MADMKLTPAQVEAIRALEDADGRLTPQQVVDAARDRASPLHGLFDWNKAEAAGKWWLHQAREILGAVKIHVTTTETVIKAPCYVMDPEADGAGYRAVASLKANPDAARESLVYTLSVAAGHIRRAYDLSGPLGMQAEIDALLRQVTGLQQQASRKTAA